MNRFPLAAATAALALAGAGTVFADDSADPLAPAPGQSPVMVVAARGVQVYECRAGKDAGGHEWAFVAPEAELFDAAGRRIGSHGAGPHWLADDGSRIVGTVKARSAAPAAGAIPWLLLETRPTGADGVFARVASVQRIHTVGGVAPPTGCSADTLGRTARVDYRADYRLFTTR